MILPTGDAMKWPDFSMKIGKIPWLNHDVEATKKRIASYYNEVYHSCYHCIFNTFSRPTNLYTAAKATKQATF